MSLERYNIFPIRHDHLLDTVFSHFHIRRCVHLSNSHRVGALLARADHSLALLIISSLLLLMKYWQCGEVTNYGEVVDMVQVATGTISIAVRSSHRSFAGWPQMETYMGYAYLNVPPAFDNRPITFVRGGRGPIKCNLIFPQPSFAMQERKFLFCGLPHRLTFKSEMCGRA